MAKDVRQPTVLEALLPLAATITLIVLAVVRWGLPLQIPLSLGLFITALFLFPLGYRWKDIQSFMIQGFLDGCSIFYVLLAIGLIIGIWMISGTIPALVYYGLQILQPRSFLVAAFSIGFLVTICMGSTWGAVSSIGVALVAIGQSFQIPAPQAAGAVLSGIFLATTISPISPLANLAASVSGADFNRHVRQVMIYNFPALLISILFFFFLGLSYAGGTGLESGLTEIMKAIERAYQMGPALFLPAILVVILGILGWQTLPTLVIGGITGGLIAVVVQGADLLQVAHAAYAGYLPENFPLTFWTNQGGMTSMYNVMCLIIISLAYAGLLGKSGMLETLFQGVLKRLSSPRGLVGFSIIGGCLIALVAGSQSLVIIITAHAFQEHYRRYNIDVHTLSRVVSDCGLMLGPIIPWNSTAVFAAGVLGVSTFAYAPYAIGSWLVPLLSLVYSLFGWGIIEGSRKEEGHQLVP
ncbi:MAG: Na+/H+ antiporter NhaC family protein [Limnochordia bacterium]